MMRRLCPRSADRACSPHEKEEAPRQAPIRTALAGLIGNVMEWFDFAVYGYFATVIGAQLFPQSSPGAPHLLTFAVFAIGFAARPIGCSPSRWAWDRAWYVMVYGVIALLLLVPMKETNRRSLDQ
jgi:MFS family permease